MKHLVIFLVAIATASLALFTPLCAPLCASDARAKTVTIAMKPCKMKRDLVPFVTGASDQLTRTGKVSVDGSLYNIYLPEKRGMTYNISPSEISKFIPFRSTYVSVDQNQDGQINNWESYYAELPLRIGDRMFNILAISDDGGSVQLEESNSPVVGAVLGRIAPDVELTTIEGKKIRIRDYKGKVLVIDSWAPS